MSCTIPGGQGPWFVSLLFNTSEKSKKQTHLLAHTHPHLIVEYLNKGSANKNNEDTNCWVIMIKVGPFTNWQKCVAYLNLWTHKTRGKSRRIERGIEIFTEYCKAMGLVMWVQRDEKDVAIRKMIEKDQFSEEPLLLFATQQQQQQQPKQLKKSNKKRQQLTNVDELEQMLGNDISVAEIKKVVYKKIKK